MTLINYILILPFATGLACLIIVLSVDYYSWFRALSLKSKIKLQKSLSFSWLFSSLKEIFRESLLHLRIYRQNPRLWYMHMSLAFGWFLLIIAGNVESVWMTGNILSPPWESVFFDYFSRQQYTTGWPVSFFNHLMDILLLFILSGLFLAIYKRFNSRLLGLKKRPLHNYSDRLAMIFLWFIFPARLVAETLNHTFYQGGGFMTGFLGNLLTLPYSMRFLSDAAWIVYSISLGGFFVVLPFSRYMHILTEVPHIFLKKAHVHTQQDKGCTQFQVHACSSCGICLNSCQMTSRNGYSKGQTYYFIRNLRDAAGASDNTIMNCLMCGRCMEACPVRIDSLSIRMNERRRINDALKFDFPFPDQPDQRISPVRIVFFGGCMAKFTPSVTSSMKRIFNYYEENFTMIDETESICCGRPMFLSGQKQAYLQIMKHTRERILSYHPKLIITSCPICLNMFRTNYFFPVPVIHHTQYLDTLVGQNLPGPVPTGQKTIYHDPCELGRFLGIYREPRNVLRKIVRLQNNSYRYDQALCCGGSLAELELDSSEKQNLAAEAIRQLILPDTQQLATACPVCKISFSSANIIPVRDIAELYAESLSALSAVEEWADKETVMRY